MTTITLTGSNDFARNQTLQNLTREFVAAHGDMALERLDGEEAAFARLQESLQSLPFLADRKLVVLRAPGANKQFTEAAETLLKDLPETTDVIIVEPKLDKRLSYYKLLRKATDFREFTELDTNGLAKWAVDYAKTHGGTLSLGDARMLVDRVGQGQQFLQNELDKLLAYEPKITHADVELLTERQPQSTIFELLDAAFAGDAAHALALYREQRALKVEPQAIIGLLGWQLHVLALVKAAGARGADDIAREAKISPFVVRKSQGIVRVQTAVRLKKMVGDLLVLDVRLKTTAIDADEATQHFLLTLAEA